MMNFNAILRETSNRRVSVEQKRTLEGPTISGCQSEALAINLLLEEALAKSGGNLIEPNLITLVRDFNSNDISGVLRDKIRRLQKRLDAGGDPPEIQMILRIILRSKLKLLENQQGSQPSTPVSSDDKDEEDYDVYSQDESSIKHRKEDEDDPDDVSFNKVTEEVDDDSSIIQINQSYSAPTSTPPTSDSEDDEKVYPVVFINEVSEHHPNSLFTFEQNAKQFIFFTINKSKNIKVKRNMSDVAKTPKPLKKNRKAEQVTITDDKGLQTTIKKHKKIKKQ